MRGLRPLVGIYAAVGALAVPGVLSAATDLQPQAQELAPPADGALVKPGGGVAAPQDPGGQTGGQASEVEASEAEASEAEGEPGKQATQQVAMVSGNRFDPESITVNVGDTVTWINKDSVPHNAIADDNSFRTDTIAGGESASVTIDSAGSFPYFCSLHAGMEGRISTPGADTGGDSGGNVPSQTPSGGGSGGGDKQDTPTVPPSSGSNFGTQPGTVPSGSSGSGSSLPTTGADSAWFAIAGLWVLAVGFGVRTAIGGSRP